MKIFAKIAAAALIAGAGMVAAQAGEDDVGLKASGNAGGPGGDVVVKRNAETNGANVGIDHAVNADRRATEDPRINRDHELRVVPSETTSPGAPHR